MDTVKVDIQKLQLLNDRIAQTIDALNQVRMSVHGIQHSGPQWSPFQQVPQYGFQNPFLGYPQPFGSFSPSVYPTQFGSPFTSGLSHTSPQTMQTMPYTPYTPYTPYAQYTNGISHTSLDPTWQTRTPFVQYPYLNTIW